MFGAEAGDRYALAETRIRQVRRLWTEVTPRPVQPEAAIWGGFCGPRGARSVGELGVGLLAAGDAWRRSTAKAWPRPGSLPGAGGRVHHHIDSRLPVEEVFCWADVAGLPDNLVEQNITPWCSRVGPAMAALPSPWRKDLTR